MKEETVWEILREMASALAALHQEQAGHFDVKPSNILYGKGHFWLTDFGSCRQLGSNPEKRELLSDDDSSYRFDAPERIRGTETLASDIWSLGATAFNLFMGCHVFNGMGGRSQHEGSPLPIMRKELPMLSNLVCRCLAFNPQERPSAQEIFDIADEYLKAYKESNKGRPRKIKESDATKSADVWPDEMC